MANPRTKWKFYYFAISIFASCFTPALTVSMDQLILSAATSSRALSDFVIDEDIVVVELDIKYPTDEWFELKELIEKEAGNKTRTKRNAITNLKKRWTNKEVPYVISSIFSKEQQQEVQDGIDDYNKYTCLNFRRAEARDEGVKRLLFSSGDGCRSFVGMQGGDQTIELAPLCRSKGIAMHEIGHAMGLHHMQTRTDRDNYITIKDTNIIARKKGNFQKLPKSVISDLGVPYDYNSMMHYGQRYFSFNGRRTIVTNDPKYQAIIGQREGFSFRDIKMLNFMYNCNSSCPAETCPGEGFVGKDCKCWCPGDPVKECEEVEVGQTTTTMATTSGSVECEDGDSRCPKWAATGYCEYGYVQFMKEKCPYSCAICATPTTTTTTTTTPIPTTTTMSTTTTSPTTTSSTTTTSPPTTSSTTTASTSTTTPPETTSSTEPPTTAGECKDFNPTCPAWAAGGYCAANSRYENYMKAYCRLACRFCAVVEETTPAPVCRDQNQACKSWARVGYCTKRYKDYMKEKCPFSCGYCEGSGTTPPTTTTAATTPRTTAAPCKNRNETFCPYWARKNYCNDARFEKYMRSNCERSCGVCRAFVMVSALPTPDCKNRRENCQLWASLGFCKYWSYTMYLRLYCPLACKFCGGRGNQAASLTQDDGGAGATVTGCQDRNSTYCSYWANQGLCQNTRYNINMEQNCQRSCGYCVGRPEPDETKRCEDKVAVCPSYTSRGLCTNPVYQSYMQDNCQQSCGLCTPDEIEEGEGDSSASGDCVDILPAYQCKVFKDNGECQNNGGFMGYYCKATCDTCFEPADACLDLDNTCAPFKKRGYCEKFPKYMSKNCMKSCGICQTEGAASRDSVTKNDTEVVTTEGVFGEVVIEVLNDGGTGADRPGNDDFKNGDGDSRNVIDESSSGAGGDDEGGDDNDNGSADGTDNGQGIEDPVTPANPSDITTSRANSTATKILESSPITRSPISTTAPSSTRTTTQSPSTTITTTEAVSTSSTTTEISSSTPESSTSAKECDVEPHWHFDTTDRTWKWLNCMTIGNFGDKGVDTTTVSTDSGIDSGSGSGDDANGDDDDADGSVGTESQSSTSTIVVPSTIATTVVPSTAVTTTFQSSTTTTDLSSSAVRSTFTTGGPSISSATATKCDVEPHWHFDTKEMKWKWLNCTTVGEIGDESVVSTTASSDSDDGGNVDGGSGSGSSSSGDAEGDDDSADGNVATTFTTVPPSSSTTTVTVPSSSTTTATVPSSSTTTATVPSSTTEVTKCDIEPHWHFDTKEMKWKFLNCTTVGEIGDEVAVGTTASSDSNVDGGSGSGSGNDAEGDDDSDDGNVATTSTTVPPSDSTTTATVPSSSTTTATVPSSSTTTATVPSSSTTTATVSRSTATSPSHSSTTEVTKCDIEPHWHFDTEEMKWKFLNCTTVGEIGDEVVVGTTASSDSNVDGGSGSGSGNDAEGDDDSADGNVATTSTTVPPSSSTTTATVPSSSTTTATVPSSSTTTATVPSSSTTNATVSRSTATSPSPSSTTEGTKCDVEPHWHFDRKERKWKWLNCTTVGEIGDESVVSTTASSDSYDGGDVDGGSGSGSGDGGDAESGDDSADGNGDTTSTTVPASSSTTTDAQSNTAASASASASSTTEVTKCDVEPHWHFDTKEKKWKWLNCSTVGEIGDENAVSTTTSTGSGGETEGVSGSGSGDGSDTEKGDESDDGKGEPESDGWKAPEGHQRGDVSASEFVP